MIQSNTYFTWLIFYVWLCKGWLDDSLVIHTHINYICLNTRQCEIMNKCFKLSLHKLFMMCWWKLMLPNPQCCKAWSECSIWHNGFKYLVVKVSPSLYFKLSCVWQWSFLLTGSMWCTIKIHLGSNPIFYFRWIVLRLYYVFPLLPIPCRLYWIIPVSSLNYSAALSS